MKTIMKTVSIFKKLSINFDMGKQQINKISMMKIIRSRMITGRQLLEITNETPRKSEKSHFDYQLCACQS